MSGRDGGIRPERPAILGVILAGGLARRFGGGQKALLALAGRSLLDRVLVRFAPQCAALILNVNDEAERFACYGLPMVADGIAGRPGPLAGILAALDWTTATRPDLTHVASVGTDMPFLPADLVQRLAAALGGEGPSVACSASAGRVHPIAAIWPIACRQHIRDALGRGERRVGAVARALGLATVDWPDAEPDPFLNINTPEDLARAEILLAAHASLQAR